jgi:hypothetical protein
MNSAFFCYFELGRAQAQLAESLANLPASSPTCAADRTALFIVDPSNDFMSEGGKAVRNYRLNDN